MEILRDQIWQFVGAAFGLVAIIVSIVLWWTQRRRKALSFDIISRTPLLSVEDKVKGKLQILFDGEPVQDVHLATVIIINSGNIPITSADYERPVNLSFGEEAQILTAEVTETNPDSLQASVDIEATRVVLKPVLLNGGDSITLKLLVSRLGGISVDGRIVGVKDIRTPAAQIAAYKRLLVFGSVLMLGGLIFFVVFGSNLAFALLGMGISAAGLLTLFLPQFIRDVKTGRFRRRDR